MESAADSYEPFHLQLKSQYERGSFRSFSFNFLGGVTQDGTIEVLVSGIGVRQQIPFMNLTTVA